MSEKRSKKKSKEVEQKSLPDSIEFVRFEQSDIHGISLSKIVPRHRYQTCCQKGLPFIMARFANDPRGDIPPNSGYWEEVNFGDSRLFPHPNTLREIPWSKGLARVFCEPFFEDGRSVKAHPRYVARQTLYKLNQIGYDLVASHEYEFYLVDKNTKEPVFQGNYSLTSLRNSFSDNLMLNILRSLSQIGIDVRTYHAEYGPGQLEITYEHKQGINSADNAFSFKNTLKELAQSNGLMASFMSKPWKDRSGSGCHFNHSLISLKDNQPVFFDSTKNSLSEVGEQWLAGLIAHAPALTALLCPTVNCYKRLKEHSCAPTNASWGIQNRSAAFRVKYDGSQGTYIENRIGGGSSNPYIVLAATVAAGIDGLEKKMKLQAETKGFAYNLEQKDSVIKGLPRRLEDSLDALENDKVICDILGADFVKLFVAVKKYEIAVCSKHIQDYAQQTFHERVDPFEREYYFEFF